MPTIYRWQGYRFHFYSNESKEPPHVHIRHDENECKFWLDPVALAANSGMKSHELTQLQMIVEDNRHNFLRKWNEYFG